MNINDHQLDLILNIKTISRSRNHYNNNNLNNDSKSQKNGIHTLILDLAKVFSIETKLNWTQLEYLSVRNSLIKNINFIVNMPNLFYLDIFQNPIETFTPLVVSNTFGYLCFSPPLNYFEQKILSIEKLNAIFLIADIKDSSIKKSFIQKNPNIMALNNEIMKFQFKFDLFSINQEKKFNVSHEDEKNSIFFENNTQKDKYFRHKFEIKKKEGCTNSKIIEIEKFIKDYNDKMLYLQKNGKINFSQLKVNLEEKKKLIAICDCYLNILALNNVNNNYYKYFPTKEKIDKKIIEFASIKHHKINIMIFKHVKVSSLKEFFLSVLILNIFKILSKDISFELLRLILLKSNYYQENIENKNNLDKDILNILNLEPTLLICFYYKIYDIMFGIYSNKKLSDIQLKLQMNGITDKIMSLIEHQNNFIKLLKNNSDSFKKGKIIMQELILYLNKNDIFNNMLKITQYVYDYIIFNSIQKVLALKNSNDLQFFVDIKNYMYYSIDKKQADIQSMAEKNYIKIQMKSLFNNKFFFDTENYMKTTKNFSNVFLNYKHGTFYPDKNKIKNFKNEEEIKSKEKEKIKKLYVQNNLESFFNIVKEQKNIKSNKNISKFKSQNNTDKIDGNKININTISNFYSAKFLKNTNSNRIKYNNFNKRKIDDTYYELVKRSPDKFLGYKTTSNFTTLFTQQNKNLNETKTDRYCDKNYKNETNININNELNHNEIISSSSPLKTENNRINNNFFKTAKNDFFKKNFNNKKLKYLKLNSMSDVLNNIDLCDTELIRKLKNRLNKKNQFIRLNIKNKQTKSVSLKNIKIGIKHKMEKKYLPNIQTFYFNKSLGCRINLKKIILEEENRVDSEEFTSKNKYKLKLDIDKITPLKKINKKKINILTNHNINKFNQDSF